MPSWEEDLRAAEKNAEANQYAEAAALLRSAVETAARDGTDLDVATCLVAHASILRILGELLEAEAQLKRAVDLRESRLGPQHSDTAQLWNELGRVYLGQGRFEEAHGQFRKAVRVLLANLGVTDSQTAKVFNNIGSSFFGQCRYDLAEGFYRKALNLRRAALGDGSPVVAESLDNRGAALFNLGQLEESAKLRLEAVAIFEATLGRAHPDFAVSLSNLGDTYRALGDFKKATTFLTEAVGLLRGTLGDNHPTLAITLHNLSVALLDDWLLDAAKAAETEALKIWAVDSGENHPHVGVAADVLREIEGGLSAQLGTPTGRKYKGVVTEMDAQRGFGKLSLDDGRTVPFDVSASRSGIPALGVSVLVSFGAARLGGEKVVHLEILRRWQRHKLPFLFLGTTEGDDCLAEVVFRTPGGSFERRTMVAQHEGGWARGATGRLDADEETSRADGSSRLLVFDYSTEEVDATEQQQLREAFREAVRDLLDNSEPMEGWQKEELQHDLAVAAELGLEVEPSARKVAEDKQPSGPKRRSFVSRLFGFGADD